MKKRLTKLMALLIAVILSLSCFACDLFNVDMEKAYDETFATVKVFEDAPEEKVMGKQVMDLYVANGAYYIYSMGYTVEETLEYIVESIVKSKISAQIALDYFYKLYTEEGKTVEDKWDASEYLTVDEIAEANYNVKKSVNDAIDSYIKDDTADEEKESYAPTARTAPTNATPYTHELTTEEMNDYVIDTGIATTGVSNNSERRTAYYKLLKSMEDNGYIDDNFDYNTGIITDTEYYKTSVKEQMESILVAKYERFVLYDAIKEIEYSDVAEEYARLYNKANDTNLTYAEYMDALTNASATAPVLVNKTYEGYKFGYVYNLLLGADDIQLAKIGELDKTSTADYRTKRETILRNTVVKDLRSTWITSNYDFDLVNKTFMNDYAVAENTLAYNGEVEWTNEGDYLRVVKTDDNGTYYEYTLDGKVDEDYVPEYSVKPEAMTLNGFVEYMETYLYGSSQSFDAPTLDGDIRTYKAVKSNAEITDWDDKINELLFAYSTDPGSLNTYKGYVIGDKYDLGYTETFVDEFATAGRELLNWMNDGYNSSYIIVASDYGYHIMFANELCTTDTNYATLSAFLYYEELIGEGTDASLETYYNDMLLAIRDGETEDYEDSYLYVLFQSLSNGISGEVNLAKTGAQNKAFNDDSKVKIDYDKIEYLL